METKKELKALEEAIKTLYSMKSTNQGKGH